ncbi:Uncharacterized protein Fot_21805 [Forsythia ovata]|uniref:Uncharacterized protein n=1 Tax=Forsythia ovata TaxID=205694 RepID=A0ABD1UW13_9LAMI
MESNRKRRGFIKPKMITSLYQTKKKIAVPAAPTGFIVNSEQVFPQQMHQTKQAAPPSATSVGFIVNQDQVFPQQMQKVSIVIADGSRNSNRKLDNFYGVAGDDGVDAEAAKYISSVQERFRLEHVNSEREIPINESSKHQSMKQATEEEVHSKSQGRQKVAQHDHDPRSVQRSQNAGYKGGCRRGLVNTTPIKNFAPDIDVNHHDIHGHTISEPDRTVATEQ